MTVTFVPYDVVARRSQLSVPGLSVAINCAMSESLVLFVFPGEGLMDVGKLNLYLDVYAVFTVEFTAYLWPFSAI